MKKIFARLVPVLLIMMIMIAMQGLSACAAATGSTYYVSATGNDANTGTEAAQAFSTFNKALQMADAGDIIIARGGTYSEKIIVSKSGTTGSPITIQNMAGETPILDGSGMSPGDGEGMISIFDRNNIVIKGFEIRNFKANSESSVPIGIYVEGACANIQLLNNRIHNIENPSGNAHGIAVYGTDGSSAVTGIVVSGNEIFNCKLGQSESLVLNGNVDGFKVNNNIVHDNDNIGIDFIGYEGTASDNDNARNGECVGNTVYNITSLGNPTYSDASAGGIYVDGGFNILIDRNIVKNCDIGIEIATERGPVTKDITVTNNLITDCKPQAGISFGSSEDSMGGGVENLIIFNNTLYNNTAAVQIQNANSRSNAVKNNIFRGGQPIEGKIRSNVFADNITEDPLFVNPAAGNFSLRAGSPAINAGSEVRGTIDLGGNPRVSGSKVDAGAYEFQEVHSVGVVLGNKRVVFDANTGQPFIDSQSRTLVPFRVVLEEFGCTVEWNQTERIASAALGDVMVQVPIGKPYILINGVIKPNDTSAQIRDSRTYLPIRAVLEAFGASVSWDPSTQTVIVN